MRPFNRNKIKSLLTVCVLTSLSGLSQSGGDYILDWYTIDGGGGQSSGGQYVLTGTIGQPDADWSRAGDYELLGGFWPGGPLCFVDFGDFAVFAELWLVGDVSGDLDNDEDIDFADLQSLTDYWLLDCPYKWPLR
jgi:hypothetical protein